VVLKHHVREDRKTMECHKLELKTAVLIVYDLPYYLIGSHFVEKFVKWIGLEKKMLRLNTVNAPP
jgi:hypothetical protein